MWLQEAGGNLNSPVFRFLEDKWFFFGIIKRNLSMKNDSI